MIKENDRLYSSDLHANEIMRSFLKSRLLVFRGKKIKCGKRLACFCYQFNL